MNITDCLFSFTKFQIPLNVKMGNIEKIGKIGKMKAFQKEEFGKEAAAIEIKREIIEMSQNAFQQLKTEKVIISAKHSDELLKTMISASEKVIRYKSFFCGKVFAHRFAKRVYNIAVTLYNKSRNKEAIPFLDLSLYIYLHINSYCDKESKNLVLKDLFKSKNTDILNKNRGKEPSLNLFIFSLHNSLVLSLSKCLRLQEAIEVLDKSFDYTVLSDKNGAHPSDKDFKSLIKKQFYFMKWSRRMKLKRNNSKQNLFGNMTILNENQFYTSLDNIESKMERLFGMRYLKECLIKLKKEFGSDFTFAMAKRKFYLERTLVLLSAEKRKSDFRDEIKKLKIHAKIIKTLEKIPNEFKNQRDGYLELQKIISRLDCKIHEINENSKNNHENELCFKLKTRLYCEITLLEINYLRSLNSHEKQVNQKLFTLNEKLFNRCTSSVLFIYKISPFLLLTPKLEKSLRKLLSFSLTLNLNQSLINALSHIIIKNFVSALMAKNQNNQFPNTQKNNFQIDFLKSFITATENCDLAPAIIYELLKMAENHLKKNIFENQSSPLTEMAQFYPLFSKVLFRLYQLEENTVGIIKTDKRVSKASELLSKSIQNFKNFDSPQNGLKKPYGRKWWREMTSTADCYLLLSQIVSKTGFCIGERENFYIWKRYLKWAEKQKRVKKNSFLFFLAESDFELRKRVLILCNNGVRTELKTEERNYFLRSFVVSAVNAGTIFEREGVFGKAERAFKQGERISLKMGLWDVEKFCFLSVLKLKLKKSENKINYDRMNGFVKDLKNYPVRFRILVLDCLIHLKNFSVVEQLLKEGVLDLDFPKSSELDINVEQKNLSDILSKKVIQACLKALNLFENGEKKIGNSVVFEKIDSIGNEKFRIFEKMQLACLRETLLLKYWHFSGRKDTNFLFHKDGTDKRQTELNNTKPLDLPRYNSSLVDKYSYSKHRLWRALNYYSHFETENALSESLKALKVLKYVSIVMKFSSLEAELYELLFHIAADNESKICSAFLVNEYFKCCFVLPETSLETINLDHLINSLKTVNNDEKEQNGGKNDANECYSVISNGVISEPEKEFYPDIREQPFSEFIRCIKSLPEDTEVLFLYWSGFRNNSNFGFCDKGTVLVKISAGINFDPQKHIELKRYKNQKEIELVLKEFKSVMKQCEDQTQAALKAKTRLMKREWWRDRKSLNDRLERVIQNFGKGFLEKQFSNSKVDLPRVSCKMADIKQKTNFVLIMSKELQSFPVESTSLFREKGAAVTRNFSVEMVRRGMVGKQKNVLPSTDIGRVFYILNPSKDLQKTEERFSGFFGSFEGWKGVVGKEVSCEVFGENLNRENGVLIYVGHSGGEQFMPPEKVETNGAKAVVLLMGCSSGLMRIRGMFPPEGLSYSYLLSGCPCVVGNLWDVTDRDIDRYSMALLQKWLRGRPSSLPEAVSASRGETKMAFLTGAAPVCYGVPVRMAEHSVDVPKFTVK